MEEMKAGLYLVATPIGHPEDITLRALRCLREVDVVLCEDTRVTGQLLQYHQVEARLESYHEHNAEEKREKVLQWLEQGKSCALVSDAGTPLIADPGYKLVREVIDEGYSLFSLPGACAAVTALTLSGLPSHQFYFYGFLPAKSSARKKTLQELSFLTTYIFYESKHRLLECLADIESVWGNCQVSLARELTKEFEEVLRFSLNGHRNLSALQSLRGELVLVVDRPQAKAISSDELDELIRTHLEQYSAKETAQRVSQQTGESRGKVYQRVLELKSSES